jgi:hypothetical protein
VNDRTDAVLASIDGALADAELPDAMRWSPEPEKAQDTGPLEFDGEVVPQPPQRYERPWSAGYESIDVRPGGWASYRRLIAERDALIRAGVPSSSLIRPRAPHSDAEPPGAGPLHAALNATEEQRVAFRRALDHFVANPPVITSPCPPRISDHNPPLRLAIPVQVVSVEHTESGLTVVHEIAPEDAGALLGRILDGLSVAIRPVVQEFARVFDGIAGALGITPPVARPPAGAPAEEIRAAALALRQQRHTGPPVLGPERSPRPRRIR